MAFIEMKTNKALYYIPCCHLQIANSIAVVQFYSFAGKKESITFMVDEDELGRKTYIERRSDEILFYIKKENGEYLYKHWEYGE